MTYPAHYQRNSCTDEICKQCENYYATAKRCELHRIAPHAQATCSDNTLTVWKKSDEYKLMLAADESNAKIEFIEVERSNSVKPTASALIEAREWLEGKHADSLEEKSPDKIIVSGFDNESSEVIAMIAGWEDECSYLEGWQEYLKALKSLSPIKMLIARGMITTVERESLDVTIRSRLHIDPSKSAAVLASLAGLEVKTEQMEVKIKTSFDQLNLFGMAA